MRTSRIVLIIAVLAVLAVLGSCGKNPSSEPESPASPDAPAATCPPVVTKAPTDSGADALQSDVPELVDAQMCAYDLDTSQNQEQQGWALSGEPVPVEGADVAIVTEALGALEADPEATTRICTMDLGPMWLLMFGPADSRHALTIDGYGCGETRLVGPITDLEQPLGSDANPASAPLVKPADVAALLKQKAPVQTIE